MHLVFFNHFSVFRYQMKYSSSCLIYYTKYCAQTQKKCPKRQLHPNSSTVLEKSCNKFEWNYMTFRDSQNAKRNGILIIIHWIFIYLTTNFHSCLNTYLRAYDNFFLAFSGWWLYLKFESIIYCSLSCLAPHSQTYYHTTSVIDLHQRQRQTEEQTRSGI